MLLDDVADLLVANGITDPVFKGTILDQPDDAVAIYEYGGFGPAWSHNGLDWKRPSIQVVVRSKDYTVARAKIETVFNVMASLTNRQIGQTIVLKASPVQSPFAMPQDDQHRIKLISNFDMVIQ